MGIRSHVAASTATLALALFFISPATAQPVALTKTQSAALDAYNDAVSSFKSILSQRRAQINSSQALPNLPGQALYLARNKMMGARKDLTDVVPSKIGRPNKFGIPPLYFDADNEPLIDEYKNLFDIMAARSVLAAVWLTLAAAPGLAQDRVQVVTTTTDLRSLAEAVGGERIVATSLVPANLDADSFEFI